MIDGVIYIEDFLPAPNTIFGWLLTYADCDDSMAVRKTASYGVAYNYSQMSYPYRPLPAPLLDICRRVAKRSGFLPNNCLLNYYPDGSSKMGFHSDQIADLADDTGVAIVSLGAARTLRFRQIADRDVKADYSLKPGSLLYMTQSVQQIWQHAVLKSDSDRNRISITLRKVKV